MAGKRLAEFSYHSGLPALSEAMERKDVTDGNEDDNDDDDSIVPHGVSVCSPAPAYTGTQSVCLPMEDDQAELNADGW